MEEWGLNTKWSIPQVNMELSIPSHSLSTCHDLADLGIPPFHEATISRT